MLSAVFLVDTEPGSGQGHRVRCGALADELTGRGWDTLALLSSETRYGITFDQGAWIRNADIIVHDYNPAARITVRASDGSCVYRSYLGVWANDLLTVADVSPSKTTLVIEDVPNKTRMSNEIYVCGSAGAPPGDETHLYGPEYALLRPEFRKARGQYECGFSVKDIRHIKGIAATDIAVLMAGAGAVITYAGMRAMEAACVGAPLILGVRNEGEALNAGGLIAAGAAFKDVYYDGENISYDLFIGAKRISESGMRLVDGLGCKRVADVIEERYRERA